MTGQQARSRVAVVIPNLNGLQHLTTCLNAVFGQSRPPTEVILVDDGSRDNSIDYVKAAFPDVIIVRHDRTLGVARSFNDGIRATVSEIIVLLNNDTEAEPTWLESLCRPLDEISEVGLCASKLLLFDRRTILHSAGDFYGVDGIPGNRGVWEQDRGQYDDQIDVFGACGAAAAYRRSMLDQIGLFDESLGSYCEDVDLNWRALVAGYRCVFVPHARVYHRLSATGGGTLASYFCGRNFLLVLAANLPGQILRHHWRAILRAQLRITVGSLRHLREPAARASLRGQIVGLAEIAAVRGRRQQRAKLRQISVAEIERRLGTPAPGHVAPDADLLYSLNSRDSKETEL